MNFKKWNHGLLAYRFEVSLKIPRKGILPEFDLIGELGLGNIESLGGNVNVLGAKIVCEMNKGQGNDTVVETLSRKLSVRCGYKVDLTGFHTIVAIVDIGGVAVVQPFERT